MKPFPARRLLLPCLAGLTLLTGGAVRADDALPSPPPNKRYDKLAARSPFAPPTAGPAPTAPAATPPPAPSWSDNLTVTSLMQSGNVFFATIMEKDTSARHLIRSDEVDKLTLLELASVRWAATSDAIKVTVSKGTQFADLKFDPSATADGAGSMPGMPPGLAPRPGVPNPAANFHPPLPASTVQTPPGGIVRGRPVIRANPQPPPVRPVINAPQGPARVIPPTVPPAAKDDDDDDDDT